MSRTDPSRNATTWREPDGDLVESLRAGGVAVASRATDRLAAAHDASHYLLVPQMVATPTTVAAVAHAMRVCDERGASVTFRSGGTSLSGQAGTDSVTMDTRRHFRRIDVGEDGLSVRVQPGATVRAVNARLSRHGRRLGPDPASEVACTIGGVVANNSSGMACGTHSNAYRTLRSAILVLPSGTIVDTAAADADTRLRRDEPRIHAGLTRIRDRLRGDEVLRARLERMFAIKNTMGYGLNSFLDHDEPVDILQHLVVGSEGTLAFVAEATFRTVPSPSHYATGLLVFGSLEEATAALPALVSAGFATIELLDAASLRVAQSDPAAPAAISSLRVDAHAALLVEFQEATDAGVQTRIDEAGRVLEGLALSQPARLTSDAEVRAGLWRIRKGLFTAVAGARPSGTTALLEDVAVPVQNLASTCAGLIALFDKHRYEGSVIFGHAKDGNIHFLVNEDFEGEAGVRRYAHFTDDMVDLVLAQGGTLKAEHGTGRIMAPFVPRQYGTELYEVMWEVKRLIDPGLVLNPGVLLTEDPRAHLRDLKTSPRVESEVDRCVECGYCEPACPSRDLTLTPRERIVVRREMQRARERGDDELLKALEREYEYDGVQTCAVDGMCQTACPVLINTGDLVRRLRAEGQGPLAQAGWRAAARHWDTVTTVGGAALTLAGAVPAVLPTSATAVARAVVGADVVPRYSEDLPRGGRTRVRVDAPDPAAVYFSSCTTTMFASEQGAGVAESFLRLCARADVGVRTPAGLPSLCCGTPWKSKGLTEGYSVMVAKVADALVRATDGGRLPVVCDASSCTEGLDLLLAAAGRADITVMDAVVFVEGFVLPKLPEGRRIASLTVHPTCSSTRMGADSALRRVAEAAADVVVIPDDAGCCAFAGDRGMLHPELTRSATQDEAREVDRADSVAHASTNRTCELGMTRATGRPYRHVLEVLDDVIAASAS